MAGYPIPQEDEEKVFVRRFRSDPDAAFEWLFRAYAPALRAFCGKRLNDPSEADDACHETLIKASQALPRFKKGAPVWPWLATIACNVCTDINRKRGRCFASGERTEQPDPYTCPDEAIIGRIRADLLSEAMASLPRRYYDHVRLKDLEGWTYREISDFLGSSVGSVRSTLMRARRSLREKVEEVARGKSQWPLPSLLPMLLPQARRTMASLIRSLRIRWAAWSTNDPSAALLAPAIATVMAVAMVVGPIEYTQGEPGGITDEPILTQNDQQTQEEIAPKPATRDSPDEETPPNGVTRAGVRTSGVEASLDADDDGEPEAWVYIPPIGLHCGKQQGLVVRTLCDHLPAD